jgi:hypothetical protein
MRVIRDDGARSLDIRRHMLLGNVVRLSRKEAPTMPDGLWKNVREPELASAADSAGEISEVGHR